MNSYKIYIEFFGKKLVTIIEADSILEAKSKVLERINFIKIQELDSPKYDTNEPLDFRATEQLDFLKNIFGFNK